MQFCAKGVTSYINDGISIHKYSPKQLKSNLLESGDIETSTGEYSYIRFEFTFEK